MTSGIVGRARARGRVAAAQVAAAGLLFAAGLAFVQGTGVPTAGADPLPSSAEFRTPGTYSYQVPAGLTALGFELAGASGAPGAHGAAGGLGGFSQSGVAVTPGEVLTLVVGGTDGTTTGGEGGASAGSGGGGTFVFRGSTLLMAAGGGGGGGAGAVGGQGGAGGGLVGGPGAPGFEDDSLSPSVGGGGWGGSQTAGGDSGGTVPDCSESGAPGTYLNGGSGMATPAGAPYGGGGGGGYYGGGAGSRSCSDIVGGGGGGGSSFGPQGGVYAAGVNLGNGWIIVVHAPGPAMASNDCTTGTIFEGTTLGYYTKVRVQEGGDTSVWICFRIDDGFSVRYGGKISIRPQAGVTPPTVALPTTDANAGACTAASPNNLSVPHPIATGQVGPGEPVGVTYLLDGYAGPGVSGNGEVWLCLKVNSTMLRVIVPTGAPGLPSVVLPLVTFTPDPGTPSL